MESGLSLQPGLLFWFVWAWLLGWLAFWGLVFETDFMQPKVHLELLIPASSFQVVSKQECVIMNISLSF